MVVRGSRCQNFLFRSVAYHMIIFLDTSNGDEIWEHFIGLFEHLGNYPAIGGEEIYFIGGGGVICLNMKNEEQWSQQIDGASHLLIADNKIYVSSTKGLHCLDKSNSEEKWKYPETINPFLVYDYSYPALTYDGKICVFCKTSANLLNAGKILCFEEKTDKTGAEIVWKFDMD